MNRKPRFTICQGQSFLLYFEFKTPDGEPFSLIGYSATLSAKSRTGGETTTLFTYRPGGALSIEAEAGRIIFALGWTETRLLAPGDYGLSLQLISASDWRHVAAATFLRVMDAEAVIDGAAQTIDLPDYAGWPATVNIVMEQAALTLIPAPSALGFDGGGALRPGPVIIFDGGGASRLPPPVILDFGAAA